MRVYTENNKLVTIRESKDNHFDFHKKVQTA